MATVARPFLIQGTLSLVLVACAGDDADGDPPSGTVDAGALADAAPNGFDGGAPGNEGGAADAAGELVDASQAPVDAARDATNPAVDAASGSDAATSLPRFSFFVTSLRAMRQVSGNPNGFGGNFTHGETGEGAGLRGADKICAEIAELGMPGASAKQWRAFLSTTSVNARTRIGSGPWYDRMGRLVAENLTALLQVRPQGMDAIIRDDFPNERGEPNRAGSAENGQDDNHDVVTGTNAMGNYDGSNTCDDWTSTTATGSGGPMGMNGPRVGHSWPARSGMNWMTAHRAPGCTPSVSLVQTGPGSGTGIGNGGGYGGIYCFALTP